MAGKTIRSDDVSKEQEQYVTEVKEKIIYTPRERETLIVEAIGKLQEELEKDDWEKIERQLWKLKSE